MWFRSFRFWNGLSRAHRDVIEGAANALQAVFWQVSKSEDDAKAAILNAKGVAMGVVTPAMIGEMQALTEPMQGIRPKPLGHKPRPLSKAI